MYYFPDGECVFFEIPNCIFIENHQTKFCVRNCFELIRIKFIKFL